MSGIWSLSDNSGHWPALALNGSVAFDPKWTCAAEVRFRQRLRTIYPNFDDWSDVRFLLVLGNRGDWKDERKSKGRKQLGAGGQLERRQRRNRLVLKCEHMDRARIPTRVSVGVFIQAECRLPVGRRRDEAKAATGLPCHRKERPDGLASRKP